MDKDSFRKKHKKWSDASVRLLRLRFETEELLNSFTEEEKHMLQYRLFLDSLKNQCDYLIQSAKKDKKMYNFSSDSDLDIQPIKDKSTHNSSSKTSLSEKVIQYSYKLKYIIVATLGAIAIKILELLSVFLNSSGGKN